MVGVHLVRATKLTVSPIEVEGKVCAKWVNEKLQPANIRSSIYDSGRQCFLAFYWQLVHVEGDKANSNVKCLCALFKRFLYHNGTEPSAGSISSLISNWALTVKRKVCVRLNLIKFSLVFFLYTINSDQIIYTFQAFLYYYLHLWTISQLTLFQWMKVHRHFNNNSSFLVFNRFFSRILFLAFDSIMLLFCRQNICFVFITGSQFLKNSTPKTENFDLKMNFVFLLRSTYCSALLLRFLGALV